MKKRPLFSRPRIVLLSLLCLTVAALPVPAPASAAEGFVEGAYGYRTESDITKKDAFNLLEGRLQIKDSYSPPLLREWSPVLRIKAELIADGYEERLRLKAREAALSFTPI
ncbi:MAG: hypothetical protein ACE5DR_05885, partial [Thermodesulfobacteriota bacterium]